MTNKKQENIYEKKAIGLRVPERVHEALQQKAQEIGVSQNDLILTLVEIGFKVLNGSFNLVEQGRVSVRNQ